jgi:lysozyme
MTALNVVVDLSHHNGNVDLVQAAADGIVGVIHKATQGIRYTDPLYVTNRHKASDAGLYWGAYHFGIGGDGVLQAERFLDVVEPGPADLLALDFEANPQGPSMDLEEARAFVTHVQSVTGRWPGLYAGHYLKDLLGTGSDPILGQCWFWLAQYRSTAVVPPNWTTWTMWQYTDGGLGPPPYEVAGIGRCDRNKFNGNRKRLDVLWGKE